jgi:anthranilate synthase component II
MKVLIIDNHDSFTYNLVQLLVECNTEPVIKYCENTNRSDLDLFDKILISPGPGLPSDNLKHLVRMAAGTKPLLGVCLGHQAVAEVFGAALKMASRIYHGEAVPVFFKTSNSKLFENISDGFLAGRYHSWVVDATTLPEILEITSADDKGEIMGLRHKKLDIDTVQFHPESILTPDGKKIISNWLK